MKKSYASECVIRASRKACLIGESTFVEGMSVVVTSADAVGMKWESGKKVYVHKVLEVEINHNNRPE